MKKILSLLMSLIIVLGITTGSFASTGKTALSMDRYAKEIAPDLVTMALKSRSDFNLEGVSTKSLSLGRKYIPYKDASCTTTYDDQIMYEVLSDKNIIGILTVVESNGDLTAYYGIEFAPELNHYSKGEFKIYFNKSDNKYHVQVNSSLFSQAKTLMGFANKGNSLESISLVSSRSGNSRYINIPFVKQEEEGTCWACCVGGMMYHFTGSFRTQQQVCDDMGIGYSEGGTIDDIADALNKYGVNATASRSVPSQSEIVEEINNNQPMVGGFISSNSGHAVVVRGYRVSSSALAISLRDSNTSSYRIASSSSNSWSFYNSGTKFKWKHTVYATH